MKVQVDENCKNWYLEFVKRFRQRYNDLPRIEQKFIWNVDDFNSPCQIISFIVHGNKDLTYLWVRKDPDVQDLDVSCYGPITPQNFIETAELILSNKSLNASIGEDDGVLWPYKSYGEYLENHLISLSGLILKKNLIGIEFPSDHVVGMKLSTPMNGFFWMIYGDVTKMEPERILKEIFDSALAREKAEQMGSKQSEQTQTNKEEMVSGYSTYFYPPLWIGEKPVFDFRSKVNGLFIFPFPTYKVEYKNTMFVFNQRGLFFVGINDRQRCIRYMNEIMGTAILQGYNLDIVTDLDIGEAIVTKEKGETRSQTYARSITRNWQFQQEMTPITEEVIASYTQINEEDLRLVVKNAESASINAETSNYLIFFAHASNYVRDGKYKESFLFDWLIIERYLRTRWELYLDSKGLEKDRKKKLRGWNINNLLEQLSLSEIIDYNIYNDVVSLKDIRNGLYHKGSDVSKENAIRCHKISEILIRKETNIIAPEEK